MSAVVRDATPADAPAIFKLVGEFASYLKLDDALTGSSEALAAALAEKPPFVEALAAEVDGSMVGYALFFPIYSSFRTARVLFLEDLFVTESARGRGLAKAMLARLARYTIERGCQRMEWQTGKDNEVSNALYQGIDATLDDETVIYRLKGEKLEALAAQEIR